MSEVIEKIEKEKETQTVTLPVRVTIKPVRKHSWLPENHDGAFRFGKTAEYLTVQVNRHTNTLNTGLSLEDEKRLETKMNLAPGSLSRNKGKYWETFRVAITQSGAILKPSTVYADEIAYKVFLEHQEVANSAQEFKTGTGNSAGFARYVMYSEEEEVANLNSTLNTEIEALNLFSAMSESEMRDFLKVFGKGVSKSTGLDFIKAQVYKLVKEDSKLFIQTMKDADYKVKVFIKDCIANGVLKDSAGKYTRPGGEVIAYSELQLIDFLRNKENSEVTAHIKAQLQAISK